MRILSDEHCSTKELVSLSLARKLAQAAFLSRRLVGVLIDRRGQVRWVVVGESTRLYLPDIGRIRGAKDRLRGLRLIVARPNPLPVAMGTRFFTLSQDFKTDLEKLRLDAVIEIDASRDGVDGPLVLAHLGSDINDSGQKHLIVRQFAFKNIHQLEESFLSLINDVEKDIALSEDLLSKKTSKEKLWEKAILVGVYNQNKKEGHYSMAELTELARSAKVNVVDKIMQWRPKVDPKTIVGSGKLEELCLHALSLGVELLIFDRDLSPSQLMHITDLTDLKVLDRSMLILDIFAQRAVTREGKLQVEMAQLNYSLPRLQQKQTGLSRLTGGIGGRGPGETKLEVNRRRVKEKIARLEHELKSIKGQRELRRKVRSDKGMPTLAIVGYTNAGKSTLLNSLSGSNIYAKDELFATLDPHSRRLRFPNELEVVVTDTVGFINHLPESLMKAFMATLEELYEADVLIHVVDLSDDNFLKQIEVVEDILAKLDLLAKKRLLVFNKIDLVDDVQREEKTANLSGILISAKNNTGFNQLIEASLNALLNAKNNHKGLSQEEEIVFDERPL